LSIHLGQEIIDAQKDDEEWRIGKGMNGDEWRRRSLLDGMMVMMTHCYTKGNSMFQNPGRADVVESCHDTPVAGHPGQWRTLELVQRSYWWPGMTGYVGKYIKSCDLCQRTKTFPAKPQGKLTPNEIPDRPWKIISTD